MPPVLQPFSLTIEGETTCPTVIVRGELDLGTAPQLREGLTGLSGTTRVDVDLAEVTFIDSTALGVLLSALKHYRSVGSDLQVVAASPVVAKVLEISGLAPVLGTPGD